MPANQQILIFGASTRAAAQSAIRAGWRPVCADRFADLDLQEIAEVLPLDDYPEGLVSVARASPAVPWIYTGALENHPALLERLALLGPLWGNGPDVVRAVRDPLRLFDVLERAGLPALAVRDGHSPPPPDGRWMRKPKLGSAGRGICLWDTQAARAAAPKEPIYFQERRDGRPISGLFLAAGGTSVMIGAADQLIGLPSLFARPFAYCGSVGPIGLSDVTRRQIGRTGGVIASEFGLCGLFGVDFLLEEHLAWPTEVNPRYTASVEVYERALGLPLLEWHRRACHATVTLGDAKQRAASEMGAAFRDILAEAERQRGGRQGAKVVVYAPFGVSAPDLLEFAPTHEFAGRGIEIADRPQPGSPIAQGSPVCTLLVEQRLIEQRLIEQRLIERGLNKQGLVKEGLAKDWLDPLEPALTALTVAFERGRLDR